MCESTSSQLVSPLRCCRHLAGPVIIGLFRRGDARLHHGGWRDHSNADRLRHRQVLHRRRQRVSGRVALSAHSLKGARFCGCALCRCTNCPVGKYTATTAQSVCVNCPAGSYCATAGMPATLCPAVSDRELRTP